MRAGRQRLISPKLRYFTYLKSPSTKWSTEILLKGQALHRIQPSSTNYASARLSNYYGAYCGIAAHDIAQHLDYAV